MQYLDALSKKIEWSMFISKANYSISQEPKTMPHHNGEEAEVQQFYEDLQDLLELTPKKKKKVFHITGNWNEN